MILGCVGQLRGGAAFLVADCIQDWCCEHGMTIHIHKTEKVVFNTTDSALSRLETRWSIAGAHVKVSRHFKYLGIHFHFSKGAAFGAHKAAQRGRFDVACLHRKLHDLDVGSNIAFTLHLYSAMECNLPCCMTVKYGVSTA
jgi:hypothetical protein